METILHLTRALYTHLSLSNYNENCQFYVKHRFLFIYLLSEIDLAKIFALMLIIRCDVKKIKWDCLLFILGRQAGERAV